jgi:DNA-binding response OmpR family regulator
MKIKALVVDDERELLKITIMLLKKHEFEVRGFSGALDALDFLWAGKNEDQVDLIITDVNMVGMNGIELVEEIKQHSADVKIICVSGEHNHESNCLKSGCDFFLKKPFKIEEFDETINKLLAKINKGEGE